MRSAVRCIVVSLAPLLVTSVAAAGPGLGGAVKARGKAKPRGQAPVAAAAAAGPAVAPRTVQGIVPGPIRFNRLGGDDGLPSLGVYAIAQDHEGFMWFGTRSGLVRYDGKKSRVYIHDPQNRGSLPSNDITALAVDAGGGVWVGTEGGLRRYDRATESFTGLPAAPGGTASGSPALAADESIGVLYVDSKKRLWVGLDAGGIARVDPRTGAVQVLSLLKESGLSSVAERPDGMLLFGSRGDGILVYDAQAGRVLASYTTGASSPARLPSNDVTSLLVDGRGAIWVGTEADGVAVIRGDKATLYRHQDADARTLSSDQITTIFSGPGGSVWIGTERGGLNMFNDLGGGFVRHRGDPSEPDRLSDSWVTTAAASRDGVMWIGTLSAGISTFDALSLELKYYRTGGVAVTAVAEDQKQPRYLWFGTGAGMERGGLYRLDRQTGEYAIHKRLGPETDPVQLDQHWIAALYSDAKGHLWIATHGWGLLEYLPDQDILISHQASETDDALGDVQSILPNPDGSFWIGTWGEGIAKINPSNDKGLFFSTFENDPQSLSSPYVYTVVRDVANPKVLWVGTAKGGLNRFDTSTEQVMRYTHQPDKPQTISNNNVLAIHQDRAGMLWLGTFGGGLNKFDPRTGKVKRYSGPGAPTTVYSILEDESGLLWLATDGAGVRVLDPKTDRMVGYAARDGLQGDEFAQGGSARGASGTFYFGGVNGVSALDPRRIKPDSFAPPVLLTGFRVFDEPRPVGQGDLELSYNDSVVSFQFASPAYADPRRVKYEYQLAGFHDQWISTDQGSITYTNLDPGEYVFRLRATGRHGAASAQPLVVPLVVRPPPWRTWWAYGLYGLAVVLAVLAILRYQRRKIERLHQRNRLAHVERELELTAAVQTGFLPDNNHVQDERFGLVGIQQPAGQCSGDWWWHERVNGHHVIAVGDVTGHGPGPAMVTASVSTTFRVLRQIWQDSGPVEFLRIANEQVVKSGRGQYLMQLMVAEFDGASGKLNLYSAAGFPALCMTGGTVRVVSVRGVPLGTPDFDVATQTVDLAPGDRFMLLSDGIPEIEMMNGRRLGLRKVIQIYQQGAELPLPTAADHLLNAAHAANHPREQEDDWTFVMAEWARN